MTLQATQIKTPNTPSETVIEKQNGGNVLPPFHTDNKKNFQASPIAFAN